GAVQRGVGGVDRQRRGQDLGVQLHPLPQEVLLEEGGDVGVVLARQVVGGVGPVHVLEGGCQPVAQLVAAAAAVERQEGRLPFLFVPEADAGRLALLDGAAGRRHLAVIVVEPVWWRGCRRRSPCCRCPA